ncbi:hypothetical protein AALP_AA2G239600 [Arabis alpina]|uniref:Uncharacterized protein n=1 Tax=Arabis alpina TaxID=50452 RepID=A0A087HJL1_ARAAL|nr:hypothetical protein AALP_AA2G239600 [Arabis alpina]
MKGTRAASTNPQILNLNLVKVPDLQRRDLKTETKSSHHHCHTRSILTIERNADEENIS